MKIFELKSNHKVRDLVIKSVSYANDQNCPECIWCGAMLSLDEEFQAAHWQQCQSKLAEQQEQEKGEQRDRLNLKRIAEIRRRGSGYG